MSLQILVAEDNEVNQRLILKALNILGYQADMVANGKEAVAAVAAKRYHLLFMDVMMPVMDGFEAATFIAAEYSAGNRPIMIALTASSLCLDDEKAREVGMDDYLNKPFKMEELQEKIAKWKTHLQLPA